MNGEKNFSLEKEFVSFPERIILIEKPKPLDQYGSVGEVGPGILPVFIDRESQEKMIEYLEKNKDVEAGGIIIGQVYSDKGEYYVVVEDVIPIKKEGKNEFFSLTSSDILQEESQLKEKFPNSYCIGWFRSHPGLGAVFSEADKDIHHNLFGHECQIAYVYDPLSKERGFFAWRNGNIELLSGYYERE